MNIYVSWVTYLPSDGHFLRAICSCHLVWTRSHFRIHQRNCKHIKATTSNDKNSITKCLSICNNIIPFHCFWHMVSNIWNHYINLLQTLLQINLLHLVLKIILCLLSVVVNMWHHKCILFPFRHSRVVLFKIVSQGKHK